MHFIVLKNLSMRIICLKIQNIKKTQDKNKTCHLNILLGHCEKFFYNPIIIIITINTVNVQTLSSMVTP